MDDEKLMTVKEVAKVFSLGEPVIYQLIREKRIPHIRLGRRFIRFKCKDVKQWIESKKILPKEGGHHVG